MQCVALAEEVPTEALRAALDAAATGDPTSYVALNLLGFCGFSNRQLGELLRMDAVPFLVGLARGGAEHELHRAALSLLVTLGEGGEGCTAVGRARGGAVVAAGAIAHGSGEIRALGARLARVLLGSPEGRAQAVKSAKLGRTLREGAAGGAGATAGGAADAEVARQLGMLARELEIHAERLGGGVNGC